MSVSLRALYASLEQNFVRKYAQTNWGRGQEKGATKEERGRLKKVQQGHMSRSIVSQAGRPTLERIKKRRIDWAGESAYLEKRRHARKMRSRLQPREALFLVVELCTLLFCVLLATFLSIRDTLKLECTVNITNYLSPYYKIIVPARSLPGRRRRTRSSPDPCCRLVLWPGPWGRGSARR